MQDILHIDKPKGITSYDVIRKLKEKYPRGTKIGHAGTLDPNATGLMVVGIGPGTRLLNDYLMLDKTYEAEILLGIKTDSGDITGKVLEQETIHSIDEDAVQSILKELVGPIRLPVSKFSSKKIRGKRSHALARAGEDTPTILQDMDVHRAELQNIKENLLSVKFEVSSGTYIRSLAEEIGRRLSIPTTLKNLRRTKIGTFNIEKAKQI